jgi:hypothetical protein
MKTMTSIFILANVCAASAANASPRDQSGNIPLLDRSGIQSWTAENDSTLFVQAMGGKWYRLELAIPCTGLPFETRIRFATGQTDTLDDFSSITFDGERCPVQSVSPVASPPATNQPVATK